MFVIGHMDAWKDQPDQSGLQSRSKAHLKEPRGVTASLPLWEAAAAGGWTAWGVAPFRRLADDFARTTAAVSPA